MGNGFKNKNTFSLEETTPQQISFFEEFAAATDQAPTDQEHGNRILDYTRIHIFARPDNSFEIHEIEVPIIGQGLGSEALKWLKSIANKHKVSLTAQVKPFGTHQGPLTDPDKLKNWYLKYGFQEKDSKSGNEIIYIPQ